MAGKFNPVRWTIHNAAQEFDLDANALSKRLRAESMEPGEDGKFSTKQILTSVAGDLAREKTRNEAAAADLREMKRDLERKRLVPVELVRNSLEEISVAIRQVIDHSPLLPKERETIYGNLRKLGEHDFATSNGSNEESA